MENRKIFSTRLKEVRLRTKKTQKEFAEMVNSTPATISAYENATKNPSLEIVINIAKKCNVSIDWLCGVTSNSSNKKEITTYSELMEVLKDIFSAPLTNHFCLNLYEINTFTEEPEYEINLKTNGDKKLYDMLNDFSKMREMLDSEIIDYEIFDTWYEGFLKKYDAKLPSYFFIPDFPED